MSCHDVAMKDKGVPEWMPFYLDYRGLTKLIIPFKELYKGKPN